MMYVKNIFTLSHKPLEVKSTIDIITLHGVLSHNTVHGKILAGEKLANRKQINFSSPLFTGSIWDTLVCTDCNLLAKFFLTNSFYLYGSTKFSPPKFPLYSSTYIAFI